MRRALLPLCLLMAFAVVACGDDDSTAPPTTAAPTALTGDSDEDGAGPGPAEGGSTGCEQLASEAAATQAAASFPDNPHNTWDVAGTSTDAAGRAVVEVVPTPDDVGYPRFRFVSRCDGGNVVLLGSYALDDDGWILLFTTDEAGAADLAAEG